MTSIDTLYEYAGLKFAGTLWSLLSGVGLPLILALAGIAVAVHGVVEKGSIRPLAVHFLFLILAAGLLGSTNPQGVRAPRYVVWMGQATDVLQKRAVRQINERFLTEPFEWERLAARVASARLMDPALERDVASFLASCGKTALARGEPRSPNLLRENALPYKKPCEERRRSLWQRVQSHVQEHPLHRTTLEAARAKDPGAGAGFADRYADELVVRAIDEPGSPLSETALVQGSLGQYSYTDASQRTGAVPTWVKVLLGIPGFFFGDEITNFTITGLAELHQNWENRFTTKQKYYQVITYGPHVYGLSIMILLGFFPIAGLFALIPGRWTVLVNYLKTFLSVKLWPVGWALLTTFNQRRGAFETFDAPERVSGTPFLAIAAMYLLVPALMFLIVHLATAAAALPFAQAVPSSAGPGLGPVGPAVNVAARLAK